MTHSSIFVASISLIANAASATAQAQTRGPLSLSVGAGYQFETPIWSVVQPIGADTVRLSSAFAEGLALWAAAEWTFATHFELEGMLRFLVLPIQRSCVPIRIDPQSSLGPACAGTNAKVATGSFGGAVAVLYRRFPKARWSPYLRTALGYLSLDASTVQLFSGTLFRDRSPRKGSASVDLAIGMDGPLGARRRWYVEFGDLAFAADRVGAPADSTGSSPISARVVHGFGARVGMRIDLLAEASR
ncbi:MAG: hypothetical protein ACREMW_10380 [Gemmatimonadales bacterium]